MRIISKFHDYYDRALGQGIDLSRVFVRTQETFSEASVPAELAALTKLVPRALIRNGNTKNDIRGEGFIVGFCGKAYPGVRLRVGYGEQGHIYFVYDMEQFDALCAEHNIGLDKQNILIGTSPRERFEAFFAHAEKIIPATLGDFAEKPVFLVTRHQDVSGAFTVVCNPVLKEIEFFRVFDAFSAFQEIDMFLGNIAHPSDRNMVVLDDKARIAKHGFDKASFRTPPGKKSRSSIN